MFLYGRAYLGFLLFNRAVNKLNKELMQKVFSIWTPLPGIRHRRNRIVFADDVLRLGEITGCFYRIELVPMQPHPVDTHELDLQGLTPVKSSFSPNDSYIDSVPVVFSQSLANSGLLTIISIAYLTLSARYV